MACVIHFNIFLGKAGGSSLSREVMGLKWFLVAHVPPGLDECVDTREWVRLRLLLRVLSSTDQPPRRHVNVTFTLTVSQGFCSMFPKTIWFMKMACYNCKGSLVYMNGGFLLYKHLMVCISNWTPIFKVEKWSVFDLLKCWNLQGTQKRCVQSRGFWVRRWASAPRTGCAYRREVSNTGARPAPQTAWRTGRLVSSRSRSSSACWSRADPTGVGCACRVLWAARLEGTGHAGGVLTGNAFPCGAEAEREALPRQGPLLPVCREDWRFFLTCHPPSAFLARAHVVAVAYAVGRVVRNVYRHGVLMLIHLPF